MDYQCRSKTWKNHLKRSVLLVLVFAFLLPFVPTRAKASNRILVYDKAGWKVYLDSPDSAKPYHHLHFYRYSKHVYCLRLDNMQPCDSSQKGSVPKSVMEEVMAVPRVKRVVEQYHPSIGSDWVKAIVKPLLIAGAAVLVVVSAVNIFTGPIDDVAAWAALAAAVGA